MSYHIEKGTQDLVIDGWEKGIAPSPFQGLGDVKSGNISTLPGEISVSYNRIQQSQSVITSGAITASLGGGGALVVYVGTPTLKRGTWIHITSSTITNLTNGSYFYVLNNVSGNISLSADYESTLISNFGTTGSATFDTVNMGQPIAYSSTDVSSYPSFNYFILTATGLVFKTPPGADGATTNTGKWSLIDYSAVNAADSLSGIFHYGSFIFVVTDSVYYKPSGMVAGLGHSTPWTKLKDNSATDIIISAQNHSHFSLVSIDNVVYICDSSQIDSLTVNPGSSFNAADHTTYTWTYGAVLLPTIDEATYLAQIVVQGGINLIIGALSNILYIWQPGASSSAFSPLFLAESFTKAMITVNNLVYIFAGSKGNVYITNGSSVTTALTVPDYVANNMGTNQDPFYIWGGAMYLRGRIWFSVKAPNCGGIWSFVPTINYYPEQDVGISLRCENENSYGTYSGYATVLFPSQAATDQQANGPQYYAGWDDGSSGGSANPYGIDFSDVVPATNGFLIETDAIPTGTLLDKKTFQQLEYKLAAPLAAGESVTIKYRTSLYDSFTTPAGSVVLEPSNKLSGYFTVDFQNTQWLQLQIVGISTNSGPSWVPLREIRVR